MNSAEDNSNQARGYKATLSNPNVSQGAKDNAKQQLDNLGGGVAEQPDIAQNPGNVAGGLKAYVYSPTEEVTLFDLLTGPRAINNPQVTDEGKKSAQEKLDKLG
ncbi:MAG: hypothetical protein M1833_001858 [Piccolia ochrophora]|nr:MAG: hypothetical protein M1833_001858 [Piccolia ochrophora]